MLELRPSCEQCGKKLPNTSTEAMICSFECTYCRDCSQNLFRNVCPSCGGNFVERPVRPKAMIRKYPASTLDVIKHKDITAINKMKDRYKDLKPEDR
ncbi:DUF1272 domain-containing protein [Maribacter algarum]|uniref:DUF1272 domain-containing protein n=1 Tax=Maribacter algarum (ex Zhang et al. 2020) TaxID=2578118 RepID=A0A5S3PDP9_9FLAO|nr:DUF1272 domain-containing protein [Maribacter algarum]TMM52110.1 DUF1272 domain-containing protein [Maribacter algarum]